MVEQLSGIRTVFTSRVFWQIAPWAVTAQAAYLSIYGLWSGPWLRDIADYERMTVANSLMGISLAMIVGYSAICLSSLALILALRAQVAPLVVVIILGGPLLYVGGEGAASEFVQQHRVGASVQAHDLETMGTVLEELWEHPTVLSSDLQARFQRSVLAFQMSTLLHRVGQTGTVA